MRNFAGKVSLRTMLLLPFVILMVLAVGATGYLAFQGGQTSVNDVTAQLSAEIVARIELRLDGYLQQPHLINQLNAVAMTENGVNPDDLDHLAHFLWQRGQVFRGIGSIGFANARGEVVSVNEPENYIALSSQTLTGGAIRRYAPDAQGYRSEQILSENPNYDARTREWYRQAVAADRPIWAGINLSVTGARLDQTAVLPYRDQTGRLAGVFFVDVPLAQLNVFLGELDVSQSGKVFIMEPDGLLVASSASENAFTGSGDAVQRRAATDSADPLIVMAARQAIEQAAHGDAIPAPYHGTLKFQGVRHYLHVAPYVDDYGLFWWVVVVIPDTDFMAQIRTNTRYIGFIFVAVLLAFIGMTVFVSRWVTQPLAQLSRSAQALTQGDGVYSGHVSEVGDLARAFGAMSAQLQATFVSLQAGEARYRDLFEHSPISLWEEDLSDIKSYLDSLCEDGADWRVYFEQHPEVVQECSTLVKVLSVNRATLAMFGAASQAELLEAAPQTFGEAFLPVFRDELLSLLEGRRTFEAETVSHTLQGTSLRIKVRLSLSPEHADTWSKVLIALTDTTEQKLATEALAKERLLLRLVIDNLPDAVYAKDAEGRKILANRADLTNIGKSEAEVLGRTDEDVFPAGTAAHFSADDRLVLKTGSAVVNREELLINAAGQQRWLMTTKLPMRDESGKIMGLVGIGRDVTEQKHAETALWESEQRFRSIVENTDAGYFSIDREGVICDVNPAWVALHHYDSSAEILGQPYAVTQPDADEQKTRELVGGMLHGDSQYLTGEFGRRCKDGVIAYHTLSARPVARLGEVLGVEGFIIDTTERKRTEQALREKTEELDRFFSLSLDLLAIGNRDGRFLRLNSHWETLLGYTLEELKSRPIWDFVHPDDRALTQAVAAQLISGGEMVPFVNRFRCADGTTRWIEWHSVPYGDTLVYSAARDITERKLAEGERESLLAQLQESAQQLRQILDTVPAGVLLVESDGHIVLANPLARSYLVLLADDETGDVLTHLGDYSLTDIVLAPSQGLWHTVAIGQRHFEVNSRALEAASDLERWVLVIRDVTQEREIQHNAQRQERLAAVGQLAAGIAHDFNNILAGIMLYAQMSLRMPDLPPKVGERLQVIIEQAQRAAELINQILDFSRRAVLDKRPLDLVAFVKDQVRLWTRTLPENIHIVCTADADVCLVNADLTRMQQMLMNLALNARDAMPDGGTLSLALTTLRLEKTALAPLPEMAAGDWVKLAVSDTGTGIADDVLPRLFTPFFTTKAPGKGTGLGLAQVYGIVTSHEGRIDIVTQVGHGTEFRIYLPLLSVMEGAASLATEPDLLSLGHGEVILVVEDNATTRAAVVESLQLLNYHTLEAAHGRDALEILAQRRDEVALMLSDMVMPEMGGKALAQALRQQGLSVPLVIMSGHPLDREGADLRAAGVTDWIEKPLNLSQLAELLARVLSDG